jgi:hypothetical protein
MKIAGIDPSIKSSGIVVMDLDDNLEVKDIQFYGYTTTKMYAVDEGNVHIAYLCAPDKYSALCMPERQRLTYDIISKRLDGVKFLGMEDYATSKAHTGSGSILQIAEFCGGIRYLAYTRGLGIINFGIGQIKRFATGDGDADKISMCVSFKSEYPNLYPTEIFEKLKQFESPHNDLCDAFWMCEILRELMVLEKFGEDKLDPSKFALLTTTKTLGAISLAESPMMKLGMEYESVKKKKKAKKEEVRRIKEELAKEREARKAAKKSSRKRRCES